MIEFNCLDLDFARTLKIYTTMIQFVLFFPIQAETGLGIVIMGVSGSGKS
jgi:ABC-type proline/glycine betaine transport system ATPase subunit